MSTSHDPIPHRGRIHAAWSLVVAVVAVIAMMIAGNSSASAYWTATGTGTATASTGTLAAPVDISVPASATAEVPIAWSQGSGSVTPDGYFVTRRSGATITAACASSPTALVETAGCTDTSVPPGTYTYTVTAVFQSWTTAGVSSSAVTVTNTEVNPARPSLGGAATYSVLASASIISADDTTLSGDIGVSPGASITGFPPGVYLGTRHAGDNAAAAAQSDLLAAIEDAFTRASHTEIVDDLGGKTFPVGVHHADAALALTGTVTLDAEGDPGAVFIFVMDAAFNTAAASQVVLINQAQASNVFWVVSGAATTGENSSLIGSVLAKGAITLSAGTTLTGQALSRDTVTLAGAVVSGINPRSTLLSQDQPATASSVEGNFEPHFAGSAVDGVMGTRWSSDFFDDEWIMVDLGEQTLIERVDLYWEDAHATAYELQVSDTGTDGWQTIYSTSTAPGGNEQLTVEGEGRFIRMHGTTRSSQYGYSLWEFQIFGQPIGTAQQGSSP